VIRLLLDTATSRNHLLLGASPLLKPREGDVLYRNNYGGVTVEQLMSEERQTTAQHIIQSGGKIMQRNGIAFLWHESEKTK
jgi:hypothetical protein